MDRNAPTICGLLTLAFLAFAPLPEADAPECWCRVSDPFVQDCDTIHGDVLLPWGVTLRNQAIRANDYDAYESSKRRQSVNVTDAEVVKGKAATAALSALLKGGDLYVSPGKRDRDVYGRLLGSFVVVKGGKRVRLADWAEENGHIRGK